MITKIQYTDLVSMEIVKDTNKDKMLIEVQNITEGNFLIFSDIKPLEIQINDLNNTTNMILLKQEGII